MASDEYKYSFPAIRGTQAGREYYSSMCPLKVLRKVFKFDEEEAALPPELRAQRTLNKARVPELADYILENPRDYVFSALTASVDGKVHFESLGENGHSRNIGTLSIPMDAPIIINDGQHRRAAIEKALEENPDLGRENIAVVFFHDRGLKRCQQMFADLNRHAIRPSRSLGLLFDHRDEEAERARLVVENSKLFDRCVEKERSQLPQGSQKLFTLSSLYSATNHLLEGLEFEDIPEAAGKAIEFWEEVAHHIPEWTMARDNKILAREVRSDFIHTQGVVLSALGKVGNTLLRKHPDDWKTRLAPLAGIDWSRKNKKQWDGRATKNYRIATSNQNSILTTNAIKQRLKLKLSPEEQRIENAFTGERNGRSG